MKFVCDFYVVTEFERISVNLKQDNFRFNRDLTVFYESKTKMDV